ncbi:MAG: SIR2 family protein [Acidobacteria bacterium]|nr:SIR2 family protein [Acidobacteriota bacterium]
MGYPLWRGLVRQLADEFAPALAVSDDYLGDVDKIADAAAAVGRADEYFKRLDRTFCFDGAPRKDLRFHRRLISLGFSGLITPNFDPTLEEACIAEYSGSAGVHRCEPVDLRDDRSYRVFEFLRNLGASLRHDRVLHLHGFHSLPKRLILGARDYAAAYGHDLSAPDAALRTLPRKVIWTLLATRPVLFVGFSMTDPFFNKALDLLRSDFVLTDEPAHFSIIPYDVDLTATAGVLDPAAAHEEAKQKFRERLPPWLVPIFYHAPRDPATGLQDHTGLASVIEDLGAKAGATAPAESAVDRLARRALEEL